MGKNDDNIRIYLESELSNDKRDIEDIRNMASKNMIKVQTQNERLFNKKHKEASQYKVGDFVMVANTDTTSGTSKKLIPKFRGPYEIKAVLPNDRYVVNDIVGFQWSKIPYEGIIDASRIKSYNE